ncbi:glycosyltransferase family 1 protein [Novosphingobium sp. PASSN1]|uniref:glycosyltransferase family 4 protein n=1 Tax=Novosphingobium sp. PASSN1 TaxID=2015561 RepID=UPI000BD9E137|nr:glycosyltransferase family 1 protein [Novosphingobium sp. PASSN1]OYU35996.1 MAG: glycosyl transferase [Novosphingobium sp. PASSN1]
MIQPLSRPPFAHVPHSQLADPHGPRADRPSTDHPEVVINGRFLMQPVTGVQRVARELTRAIDRLVADEGLPVRLRLVCEPDAELDDLVLRAAHVERAGSALSAKLGWRIGGHAWEQLVLPGRVRGGHLLCLGNTAPLAALHRRGGAHAAKQGGVTVMIHDLSYRQYPGAYRLHYRLGHRFMLPSLLQRAQTILTVSEREKAMLAALRPGARARIRVAQNGGWGGLPHDSETAECSAAATVLPAGMAPGYMLYVGSLSQRKNIHGVVAVAVRLAREDGCATLIVGGGSDILSPIAAEVPADVAHLVRFIGPVTELDALGQLYRDAGCLLFPSFYEASPLPPIEAMHFGCPVVVSAIPAMTERCGTAAVYCNPHDVDDMVAAVRRVLADPELFAARGRLHAAHWTWRDSAVCVLDTILGGGLVPGGLDQACRSAQAPAGEDSGLLVQAPAGQEPLSRHHARASLTAQ